MTATSTHTVDARTLVRRRLAATMNPMKRAIPPSCIRALVPSWIVAVAVLARSAPPPRIVFTDVTAAAGITFTHNSGRAGQKLLPETLGSGAAFFDADGDGWLDVLLINSKDWTPGGRRSLCALYRNNGHGGFTDITAGSGLDVEM